MKIITDKWTPLQPKWPRKIACRSCKSVLEIDKEDIISEEACTVQWETYRVHGIKCPLCKTFNCQSGRDSWKEISEPSDGTNR